MPDLRPPVPLHYDTRHFSGLVTFRHPEFEVTYVVTHGLVRRSIPQLKRFMFERIDHAIAWYERHPRIDAHWEDNAPHQLDVLGPRPWDMRKDYGTR